MEHHEISRDIPRQGYNVFVYDSRNHGPVIADCLSLVCTVRSGFFLGEVPPIRNIDKINIPILFIHGASDTFTPPEMSKEMYGRKTGIKMIYIAAGAKHAESLNADTAKYGEVIDEFLGKAAKLDKNCEYIVFYK